MKDSRDTRQSLTSQLHSFQPFIIRTQYKPCPWSARVNVCHTQGRRRLKHVCGQINDDLSTVTVWCYAVETSKPSSLKRTNTAIHGFLEFSRTNKQIKRIEILQKKSEIIYTWAKSSMYYYCSK